MIFSRWIKKMPAMSIGSALSPSGQVLKNSCYHIKSLSQNKRCSLEGFDNAAAEMVTFEIWQAASKTICEVVPFNDRKNLTPKISQIRNSYIFLSNVLVASDCYHHANHLIVQLSREDNSNNKLKEFKNAILACADAVIVLKQNLDYMKIDIAEPDIIYADLERELREVDIDASNIKPCVRVLTQCQSYIRFQTGEAKVIFQEALSDFLKSGVQKDLEEVLKVNSRADQRSISQFIKIMYSEVPKALPAFELATEWFLEPLVRGRTFCFDDMNLVKRPEVVPVQKTSKDIMLQIV